MKHKSNKPEVRKEGRNETRIHSHEIRMSGEGNERNFVGMAALYNSESQDLGGFIEIIEPGFFDEAIENSDVRCLVNHDPNQLLGRTSSGTLELTLTDEGLGYNCTNPGTSFANDLAISVDRGDVRESSFGFTVKSEYYGDDEDGDRWEFGPDGIWRRFLIPNGCKRIFDVSPVTYPAYPQTSVAQRSLQAAQDKREESQKPEIDFKKREENHLKLINIL